MNYSHCAHKKVFYSHLQLSHMAMQIPCDFSFLVEQDSIIDFEESDRPTPTVSSSHVTLMALNEVYNDAIPFLGLEEPKMPPINESIRALWDCSEEDIVHRRLTAGLRSLASKPLRTNSSRHSAPPAHRILSPTVSALIVGHSNIDIDTNSLDTRDFNPPATPIILPVKHLIEPTPFSLDAATASFVDHAECSSHSSRNVSTTSTTQDKDQTPSAADSTSTTSQLQDSERKEGRKALGWAVLSVRKRYPERYREVVRETLVGASGTERVLRCMSLADDSEAEW